MKKTIDWAEYYKGNILDYADKVDVIAHQVNCQGIMGGGLALQIKNRWPSLYKTYQFYISRYLTKNGKESRYELLGHCQLLNAGNCYVANLFGQYDIGVGLQTDYRALQKSLIYLRKLMEINRLQSVAFPWKLGCGLAGGNWDVVLPLIKNVFVESEIKVIFVEYEA